MNDGSGLVKSLYLVPEWEKTETYKTELKESEDNAMERLRLSKGIFSLLNKKMTQFANEMPQLELWPLNHLVIGNNNPKNR